MVLEAKESQTSYSGRINVKQDYPEIIAELVERARPAELIHFNLSSFFSEKPLKSFSAKLTETMTFFSVYIVMEPLEESLWEDSRYADKEEVQLCSLVEEQARKYWMERNREHLELIDKRMEELRNNPEYKDMKEGDLRDKVIEQLDKEVYPIALERLKEEFQWMYEDEWEEYWKRPTFIRKEPNTVIIVDTTCLPRSITGTAEMHGSSITLAGIQEAAFTMHRAALGGSGQRYNHGFYGHLFALINREKPVPTYFFTHDKQNGFVLDRHEKSLWLNFYEGKEACHDRFYQ
jgi:hypothetical protein